MPLRACTHVTESRSIMNLTLRELKVVRSYRRRGQMLIVHVSFLVFNAGDSKTAARLNDITARLTDEIEGIERLIETR
jgi:hypothetical protein